MTEPPASPPQLAITKITDLDEDSLAHCATYEFNKKKEKRMFSIVSLWINPYEFAF